MDAPVRHPPSAEPEPALAAVPTLAPEYARIIAQMAAALRVAQIAIDDWVSLSAPDHCQPQRVKEARDRLGEHGLLFYLAIVSDSIRHALRGAPVALDPEHDDAVCWRAFCALPQTVRMQLVSEYVSPTQLDNVMHNNTAATMPWTSAEG